MEKIVNCKKCGKAIVVSGPNDGTKEQSTNLECPDPQCRSQRGDMAGGYHLHEKTEIVGEIGGDLFADLLQNRAGFRRWLGGFGDRTADYDMTGS